MSAQRQRYLEKALLPAVAGLLLLTTAAQSAVLATATPPLSNSSLTTQLSNSSMEEPRVLRTHRSCGSEHDSFCANGGECMYPQDSDKPSCICTASYSGPRCMLFTDTAHRPLEMEQVIGISLGVIMLIFLLALIAFCCVYKKWKKSAPLIKSTPSENSV